MDNRVDWRTEDRRSIVSEYDHFMDGVDEFVFVPLTAATFGNAMKTDPVGNGGDADPTPCADAA